MLKTVFERCTETVVDTVNGGIQRGRQTGAEIVNAIRDVSQNGGGGEPVNVTLMIDGRTLARVLWNPLNDIAYQRGLPIGG